jgi:hypothetical protein
MPTPRSILFSLLAATTLAGPALAQVPLGGIVTGNDIDRVQEIASAYGPVERRNDPDGTWIRGEIDDIVYSISFLNCDDTHANCTSVQFRAWWESEGRISLDDMNQWNRDRRFSAAYLDDDLNATIEWDVNLAGGVTAVNFDDNLQWWRAVLRQFRDRVEAADAAPEAETPPPLTK